MVEITKTQFSELTEPMWRIRSRLIWRSFIENWKLFMEYPIGMIGLGIIIIFGLMALAHPILMKYVWEPRVYDPVIGYDISILAHPSPPSSTHLLGTDPLGRDVLSQLLYGTRFGFSLGISAALVSVIVSTTVGALSAYYGGIVDVLFMRLADVVIMLPFIAILIVLSALIEFNGFSLAIVYGLLVGFGGQTIVIKSQALSIKVKPYIEAARAAGGSDWHIIFTHLIPNLMPLSFLYMMFTVTGAVFAEAALSFFGLLNIRMSWGIMINTAQAAGYLLAGPEYLHLMLPAGLAITLLCSSFYMVGRALDEVVNPRLRQR
ncbi:MAG: ABC transporter permease [Anaerolineae bacterium SM23_ 63]|nr:MAG: ABC transporter permease [Anaerolineae bacterium SM23_ 63]HEY47883.1 ABC transporter permease [Anaerolineae bacterium]